MRRVVIAVVSAGLLAALIVEDVSRRSFERRYRTVVESRRQLTMQVAEIVATHDGLRRDLDQERRRSAELAEALRSTRVQLEETVGRLTEETRGAGELNMRLARLQQQMDQLQGELAIALQDREDAAGAPQESRPVQLERIIVSHATAPGLQGRVLSVHQDWDFVIISLGWGTVRIGDTVSIIRNDRLLAHARIERVQESACAATLLPAWKAADIRANDLVHVLGVNDDETAEKS
ncbi:MAG: hypothetical protein HYY90_03440 [Candidatus Omnitrophica bacterium]|nr:hypothetical protein [Candidatus Omnitrophota bacterium]MBI3083396.1 hypothetical protein [Candidatus Omnitrophota bacterium]